MTATAPKLFECLRCGTKFRGLARHWSPCPGIPYILASDGKPTPCTGRIVDTALYLSGAVGIYDPVKWLVRLCTSSSAQ